MNDHKRRSLMRKLEHIERVEFTIVDELGQRKGHAMVSDKIDADFIIPLDIKTDLKLTNGKTYVAFDLSFKGKSSNMLDRQSLLDLYPFFNPTNLGEWMRLEADFFAEAVETGRYDELMGRIEPDGDEDSAKSWHVMEFAASGGSFMWSKTLVRGVFSQHLHKIKARYQEKVRYPVPGGSSYVMTDDVARLAGYTDVVVPAGHAMIDLKRATVWVNGDDWADHLAEIWGGADSDDRLNIQPFTDTDDVRKVLLWRSPNQLGEYAVLIPTENSDVIEWETAGEPVVYPKMDSSVLPVRIDKRDMQYTCSMGAVERGESKPYSIKEMRFAISRAAANSGTLGMYCNLLMIFVAAVGNLPNSLHLPLEIIIDATVKNGNDVSSAKDWCYFQAGSLLSAGTRIPHLVADKFAGLIGKDKTFQLTTDHWLDKMELTVAAHIDYTERKRDALMNTCVMPVEVAAYAAEMKDAPMGVGLVQVYNTAVNHFIRKNNGVITVDIFDQVRERCEEYITTVDGDIAEVMIGALNAANTSNQNDSACWQLEGDGEREGGFARLTIDALRQIGLLNEIGLTEAGLIAYPSAQVRETTQIAIRVTAVWYRLLIATDKELPDGISMSELAKSKPEKASSAKETVKAWASAGKFNTTWKVGEHGGRKVLITNNGNVFGFVHQDHADKVSDQVTIVSAFATDGNVTAVIKIA